MLVLSFLSKYFRSSLSSSRTKCYQGDRQCSVAFLLGCCRQLKVLKSSKCRCGSRQEQRRLKLLGQNQKRAIVGWLRKLPSNENRFPRGCVSVKYTLNCFQFMVNSSSSLYSVSLSGHRWSWLSSTSCPL